MGADVGNQIVTIRYGRPVDSDIVNDRFRDIRMLGIYKGGRMTWTPDVVTLTPLVCEIAGVTGSPAEYHQVRVETTINVSQALANGQYLVLRWTYSGVEDTDFMDIVSVDTPETDDIIVGQVATGQVIYAERTTPNTHHLFLHVEEMETPNNYVRVRSGVGHAGADHFPIADRTLLISGAVGGEVVYVYVTDSGGIAQTKVATTYAGKALLAKITYPADNIIENSDIEDVRSFITPPAIPDEKTISRDTNGKLQVQVDGNTIEEDGITGKLKIKQGGTTQRNQSVGTTDVNTSSNVFSDLVDMSLTITTTGGDLLVMFSTSFFGASDYSWEVRLLIDGVVKRILGDNSFMVGYNHHLPLSFQWLETGLSATSHTVKIQWRRIIGSVAQYGASYSRVLTTIEFKN